jgi:hypothetical protein
VPDKPAEPSPFEKFAALTKKVMAVPRKEIQEREQEYQQQRAKKKKPVH